MISPDKLKKVESLIKDIQDLCPEANVKGLVKWTQNEWKNKIKIRYRWRFKHYHSSNWQEMFVSKKDNIKDCMSYIENFEGLDKFGSKCWDNFEYEII